MDKQEYGFRSFQELLELPREKYKAMSIEERRDYADKLNRAIDASNTVVAEALFGLCPDCKARRHETH